MVAERPRYDLPTAVTFFLAGLGAGSLLALIFSPRWGYALDLVGSAIAQNKG